MYRIRFRSRSDFRVERAYRTWSHPFYGTHPPGGDPIEYGHFSFLEEMEDQLDEARQHTALDSLYPVHPIRHLKIGTQSLPIGSFLSDEWGLGHGDEINWEIDVVGSYFYGLSKELAYEIVAVPPKSEVYKLGLQGFNELSTQIPSDISIANFIYELKDFEGLVEKFKKKPKGPSGKRPPKFKKRKPSGPKTVNDAYLQYNFAWAPLVGDLQKIMQISERVTKRLDYLRQTRNQPTPVHFRRKEFWEDPNVGIPQSKISTFQSGGYYYFDHVIRRATHDFVVSGILNQDLNGLDDAWASWKATCAAMGLGNPLKVVWNALPYSFLVDWLLPVSDWLGRNQIEPFIGKFNLYNICSSVRTEAIVDVRFHYHNHAGDQYALAGSWYTTRYDRQLGIPVILPSDVLTEPSSNQQKLLASLWASKLLRK